MLKKKTLPGLFLLVSGPDLAVGPLKRHQTELAFRVCVRTTDSELSPAGTAELSELSKLADWSGPVALILLDKLQCCNPALRNQVGG